MPQFMLETGTAESHARFDALPEFVQGFFECAFFTANRPGDYGDGAGDPCPDCGAELEESDDPAGFVICPAHGCSYVSAGIGEAAGVDLLTPEAWAGLEGEARRFMASHMGDLIEATARPGYDMRAAGADFYYTRNGHGVGFWDRGLGDVGDRLSDAARGCGELDLTAGDDLRIHCYPCPEPWAGDPEPDPAPLANVGGRYGAPMGRRAYEATEGDSATVRRVTLDPGGYDAGGAYWGIGQPLFRAVADDGANLGFIRATDHGAAVAKFSEMGITVKGE